MFNSDGQFVFNCEKVKIVVYSIWYAKLVNILICLSFWKRWALTRRICTYTEVYNWQNKMRTYLKELSYTAPIFCFLFSHDFHLSYLSIQLQRTTRNLLMGCRESCAFHCLQNSPVLSRKLTSFSVFWFLSVYFIWQQANSFSSV